jgi:(E)-4-hydroxy-3-methylbut-2-enyl-diphosphate synthase
MVFLSGVTSHHIDEPAMVDHIVGLVEAKAAEIEAAKAAKLAAEGGMLVAAE